MAAYDGYKVKDRSGKVAKRTRPAVKVNGTPNIAPRIYDIAKRVAAGKRNAKAYIEA